MDKHEESTDHKALRVNLDPMVFGTFAEIGAGQDTARHFFTVGGAAGTIAKTMSAYDMTFSDEIYGKVGRYVSRERLACMLQHEYSLLLQRLSESRGARTTFFVFANTVAARNFTGTNECHGWLGIRFQTEPLSAPNNIILHVRMTDRENVLQQQALGVIGVNLVHGAFYQRSNPEELIQSLLDELSIDRIEVDILEFSGPTFQGVDNRLMALKLVQKKLTAATMFAPDGQILQPSEVLRKRPVLVQRGSFCPVTHVNLDMLHGAREKFLKEPGIREKDPLILFELNVHDKTRSSELSDDDFIARADSLAALGHNVMISDYWEYYLLTAYFRRYTKESLAMTIGVNALLNILDERYYEQLEGGILEALGRLFKQRVKLLVYPMRKESYLRYQQRVAGAVSTPTSDQLPALITTKDVQIASHLQYLYQHLISAQWIEDIELIVEERLDIFGEEVLGQIRSGNPDWEKHVPAPAAAIIKQKRIFQSGDSSTSSVQY